MKCADISMGSNNFNHRTWQMESHSYMRKVTWSISGWLLSSIFSTTFFWAGSRLLAHDVNIKSYSNTQPAKAWNIVCTSMCKSHKSQRLKLHLFAELFSFLPFTFQKPFLLGSTEMQPASSCRQAEPISLPLLFPCLPHKGQGAVNHSCNRVKNRWHFNYHKEGEWGCELLKAFWILTAPLPHIYDNVDWRNEMKQLGCMCMQAKWYRIKLGHHYHGTYDEVVARQLDAGSHTHTFAHTNIRAQAWLPSLIAKRTNSLEKRKKKKKKNPHEISMTHSTLISIYTV